MTDWTIVGDSRREDAFETRFGGDPRYLAVLHQVWEERDAWLRRELDAMWELHVQKGQDYASDTDPFANYNRAAKLGVPGFMSALIRLGEKMSRIETFVKHGTLANEGFVDSLRDAAAIALIAKVLYSEELVRKDDGNGAGTGKHTDAGR